MEMEGVTTGTVQLRGAAPWTEAHMYLPLPISEWSAPITPESVASALRLHRR